MPPDPSRVAPEPNDRERDTGIEAIHETYVEPLGGGQRGYQARCWSCTWTGPEHLRGPEQLGTPESRAHKRAAKQDAAQHRAKARTVEELEGALRTQTEEFKALRAGEGEKRWHKAYLVAEARCSEIRAETIAEIRRWLQKRVKPTLVWLDDFDTEFAAPRARNDEHGTENEG
jgi:hypothetical protein